jgi:hypothetical protein
MHACCRHVLPDNGPSASKTQPLMQGLANEWPRNVCYVHLYVQELVYRVGGREAKSPAGTQ